MALTPPPGYDRDREIVDAVRGGSVRSFSIIIDRHRDRAMTLAVRLLRERGEAEEAVQDAFLRAFRALDGFRGEARFSTWFYRIVYNSCMSRLRTAGRVRVDDTAPEVDGASATFADEETDIQERLETEELREIMMEEMSRLPVHYSASLTLLYVQELKYDEIAQVLQVPLGTVKTNISRGRDLLRRRVLDRIGEEALT